MEIRVEYVERKFNKFNELMFAGRLPKIPVYLTESKRFLGLCRWSIKKLPNGRKEYYDYQLRINTRIYLPENEVEDVIIHEMIHYFIAYNGLEDTSSHGNIFKSIMNSINTNYGRNVSLKYKMSEEQRSQICGTKPQWHMIAVIYLTDGSTGVKVLPLYESKILNYYNYVANANNVRGVDLYMHYDPFFNQYPTSSAYKIHPINENILEEHLIDSKKYKVKNNRLVEVED